MSESPVSDEGPTTTNPVGERPRFVDAHRVTIAAPRERVWRSLSFYCRNNLARERGNPAFRLLGTTPPSGFGIRREDPDARIELAGRHRFSRYLLVFELAETDADTTELTALTYADFPGVLGRVYRLLVISSGVHVLAMRRMLSAIQHTDPR